jgi:5'-deoxynucleotidase
MSLRDLRENLERLRSVRRFATWPCIHPQNTAEHSFNVAVLCWEVATQYGSVYDFDERPEDVAVMGLVHDTGEVLTGDILRYVKRRSLVLIEEVFKAEADAVRVLTDGLLVSRHWRGFFLETETTSSRAALLVRLCDTLDVWYYAQSEHALGNAQIWAALEHGFGFHPLADSPKFIEGLVKDFPTEGERIWLTEYLDKNL